MVFKFELDSPFFSRHIARTSAPGSRIIGIGYQSTKAFRDYLTANDPVNQNVAFFPSATVTDCARCFGGTRQR
ncbi:MAG: hypothetical protein GF363_08580 [Chitinivibrionales bacterium]|nr:hypothetical protein [Chitinivibrionales bacterium]